jgi:hypothetical protein
MAGFTGAPPIVTDGLVFAVDAANYESYPGSGTTWSDLAGSNNGTLTNGPTFDSENGGSITLDGTNDYVNCGNSNPIIGNTNFSLSVWLDTGTHSNFGLALYIGNASTRQSAWVGFCSSANTNAGTGNTIGGGLYGRNLGSGINPNTGWHYVVLTYNTSILRLYVDGTQTTTLSESSANIQDSSIRLGRSNTGTAYYYNGSIASTQLYNRTLSSTEVLQNYNALKSRFGL